MRTEQSVSAQEFAALLPGADPAEKQERALGIETGGSSFQAIVQPLARDAEEAGQLGFAAAAAEVRQRLFDEGIPKRCPGPRPQRRSDPPAPAQLNGLLHTVDAGLGRAMAFRDGVANLGGIGWWRGLVMSVLAGPPQAMIAYSGFILVPLGHGTTIQPACAALFGLILATVVLRERATATRVLGGVTIIAGLVVFGAESLATIGHSGVGGDLLFVTAGLFWATFGTLLRYFRMSGPRATAVVAVLSVVVYAPLYAILVGFGGLAQQSLAENLVQVVAQGVLAGALPIYLFARSVILLGAGRAATFPALTNRRTLRQSNAFNSWARSERASVTSAVCAARSSPRKLQSRSQTALPPPKKGNVWSASRSLLSALSASPLLVTVASITSWSMPPRASDQCW